MFPEARVALLEALRDAWAVVQPVDCAGCGAPDRAICARCRSALVPHPATQRRRSIEGLSVPVRAAAGYEGVVRSILLAGKDHGRADALRALAPMLATVVIDEAATVVARDGAPVELAWVPSTPAALRRRGFDPVLVVLRAAGLPTSRVLAAAGAVQQKALGREERQASAVGRLRPRGALAGRRFVLVDDVVTTGATIRAAVAAISLGGGDVSSVCCLGTVDLSHPARDRPSGDR